MTPALLSSYVWRMLGSWMPQLGLWYWAGTQVSQCNPTGDTQIHIHTQQDTCACPSAPASHCGITPVLPISDLLSCFFKLQKQAAIWQFWASQLNDKYSIINCFCLLMCQCFAISVPLQILWCHIKQSSYYKLADLITYSSHSTFFFYHFTNSKLLLLNPRCLSSTIYVAQYKCSWRGIPTANVWVWECIKTTMPLCNLGCDLSLRDTRFLLLRGSCAASKPGSQWEFCAVWVQGDTLNSWNPGRWPLECSTAVATVD